jgi:hypothetical protein
MWILAAPLCLMMPPGSAVFADEPCIGSKGDISKEMALFTESSAALVAGKNLDSAPTIAPDHLYQLQLAPQNQVAFALPPGRSGLTDGYAGVVQLTLKAAGHYRVSVDTPLWIDVVGNGSLAAVRDFQGLHGCDAPRKIVEFDLTGGTHFVLQVSGAAKTSVRVTVTPAPAT